MYQTKKSGTAAGPGRTTEPAGWQPGLSCTSDHLVHLDPVEMAFTWYIPVTSPPYDHVSDIGGIPGISLVYSWYIFIGCSSLLVKIKRS